MSSSVCGVGPGLALVCGVILILSLCDGARAELCYVDSNTGKGVHCEPNCCGSNPTYCCDKDTFILQTAIFGSLGVVFIICLVICCVCKKRKRNQKKAALKAASAPKVKAAPAAPKPAIAVVSSASVAGSGGGGGGYLNQGFDAHEPTVDAPTNTASHPGPQQNASRNEDISLREIHASTSPAPQPPPPSYDDDRDQDKPATAAAPPSGSMYSEHHYPPPATPSLPEVTYVSESPNSRSESPVLGS